MEVVGRLGWNCYFREQRKYSEWVNLFLLCVHARVCDMHLYVHSSAALCACLWLLEKNVRHFVLLFFCLFLFEAESLTDPRACLFHEFWWFWVKISFQDWGTDKCGHTQLLMWVLGNELKRSLGPSLTLRLTQEVLTTELSPHDCGVVEGFCHWSWNWLTRETWQSSFLNPNP